MARRLLVLAIVSLTGLPSAPQDDEIDPDVIERPAHEREARRARSAGDVQSARGREVDRNPKKSAPAGTLA